MTSRVKLTPAMLVDFLKKNGRSSAADVRKNFGGVDSTCRKHLTLAVDAGFIRREKEGNLAFYAAAENPPQIVRKKTAILDAPSASCHLNQVWGWNRARRSAA